MSSIFWFHRDHRLEDNEALNAALEQGPVLPVALLDRSWLDALHPVRAHSWVESLKSLDASLPDGLELIIGHDAKEAQESMVEVAKQRQIRSVFATRAYDPSGVQRQTAAREILAKAGIELHLVSSYYAVSPGSVLKPVDSTPYRVYTPFYRAWLQVGWHRPFKLPADAAWLRASLKANFELLGSAAPFVIRAGEQYALRTFDRFARRALDEYGDLRNRADLSGTSHLSHALAHGEIHPRTLLAALGDRPGHEVFRKEIAWREFYADVLHWNPDSERDYLDKRYALMQYDSGETAELRLEAWKTGRTGYPMVDAGMRQLAATGWMHNRVRMIVASFLVKDLHLEWQVGAQHFENLLTDFDPASNSHGWQWTAGCGTDASPYFRVFNPVLQGLKFDPNGDYVRRWIPELAHISDSSIHEPWNLLDGLQHGYPAPIVDHSAERDEALRRLDGLKQDKPEFRS